MFPTGPLRENCKITGCDRSLSGPRGVRCRRRHSAVRSALVHGAWDPVVGGGRLLPVPSRASPAGPQLLGTPLSAIAKQWTQTGRATAAAYTIGWMVCPPRLVICHASWGRFYCCPRSRRSSKRVDVAYGYPAGRSPVRRPSTPRSAICHDPVCSLYFDYTMFRNLQLRGISETCCPFSAK